MSWSSGDLALIRIKYAYAIELLLLICFSTFYISKMEVNFDRSIARQTLKISLPIVASALLGLLINLSDRYFIEKYGSLKDLSIYNLAIVISGVVPFVFASFQNIWLPHFLKEKDMRANMLRSKRVVMRLGFLFIGLSIATMIVLKFTLLVGIVDSRYESVMPLLPIVLLTNVVMSLSPMYSNHLIYLNRLYLVVVVGVPIAILSVVLNVWLVPSFNIYGAAIASLVSSLCYLIAYAFLVDYYYNLNLKEIGDLRIK
jgi:O-antigen/teichoic acid export membrane protein